MKTFKFKNKLELVTKTYTVKMAAEEVSNLNKQMCNEGVKIKINKKDHKLLRVHPPLRTKEDGIMQVQIVVEEINEDIS